MRGTDDLMVLKQAFGQSELRELAVGEDLVRRGSGRNRAECPGCRNGDPRGISIGETNGVGVWNCHRDQQHRGTAIDFLALSRSISVADAIRELERMHGPSSLQATRRPAPAPTHPPLPEVKALWGACVPVFGEAEIGTAWGARGLDLGHIDDRGLARVLPRGASAPGWARCGGQEWSTSGHRLIVPMFDAQGTMRSVHARAASGKRKGLSPAGHAVGGLVMADPLARLLLAGAACGEGESATDVVRRCGMVVCEGVPDFLTWATRWGDAAENAPAVIGIIAGSWTTDIASRVPVGTRVFVRAHADDAGAKYASHVASLLEDRCAVRLAVAEKERG